MDLSTPPTQDVSLKKYDKLILTGMISVVLAIVAATGWGIYVLLPILLTMAENGVLLLVMLGVLAFLGIGLLNVAMNFQNILLKMKMGAQALRRKIISGNPIAAIDVSIANLTDQYQKACQLATEADAATKHLKLQIRADDKKSGALDKAENEDRLAQAAMSSKRPQLEVNEHLIKSERAHKMAETLQPLLERQQTRQARIEDARQIAKAKISDLTDQKENMTVLLDAYKADAKQSRALSAFFGSKSKEMANIEIAVDEIVKQGTQAEAEVEQMLRDAEPQIQEEALQRDADVIAAKNRLGKGTSPLGLPAASPTDLPTDLPVKDGELIERKKR